MDALDPQGVAVQSILPQFFGSADQPDALAAIRAWTGGLFDSLAEQDELVDSGALRDLKVPVSIIFGESDRYLNRLLAGEIAGLFTDPSLHLVQDASHWPQHDQPPGRGGSPGRHGEHRKPAMSLDQQHATSLPRRRIEEALVAAGLDLNDLRREDLAASTTSTTSATQSTTTTIDQGVTTTSG
jgi:pimeloyl-ACP methyl ester carboxylesterase